MARAEVVAGEECRQSVRSKSVVCTGGGGGMFNVDT